MHLHPTRLLRVLAALTFTAASMAGGNEKPSDSSVRELLRVSGAQTASGALFEEMERVTEVALRGLRGEFAHHEGGEEALVSLAREIKDIMREELSWERLEPVYIVVYSDLFDQEEVDALIEFFTSPEGRAYVAKQPRISKRTATLLEPRTGPIMDRVNRAITDAVDSLGGHHHGHHHHSHRHHDHGHEVGTPGPGNAHPPAGR
ncbi:MAG: DUF2059 domain-containing protein [Opitutales bacterium]|nr:DUF2059 domain-containing protein [Opitutales bacterium]